MEQQINNVSTGMESSTPPPQVVTQPVAAPVAPAPPMTIQENAMQQQPPAMAEGGVTSSASGNDTMAFLKDINWMEVAFMFLGAWGMYSAINYYRYKLKEERIGYYDVQRQLDKINQQIGNLQLSNAQPAKNNNNSMVSFA